MVGVVLAAIVALAQATPGAGSGAVTAATPVSTATSGGHAVSPVTVTGVKPHGDAGDPSEIICHREKVLGTCSPRKSAAGATNWSIAAAWTRTRSPPAQALRPWKDPAG